LTGNGKVDFLVYRSADDVHDGGGLKPCFLGAFDEKGQVLWTSGEGGMQPARPGPVLLHDINGDGATEVVCFFHQATIPCDARKMEDVVVQVREGITGKVLTQDAPAELRKCSGSGANWVHQRLLAADFRGKEVPRDFVVKLGPTILAMNEHLEVLWTYECPWTEYSRCPAYIPSVGDIDRDGKDEVNGGYFLLDDDGAVLWEKQLGRHMDSVAIAPWDHGIPRAICSGFGQVVDRNGKVILKLGEELVPHGQEIRVAHFDDRSEGPQMMIRYNGHTPEVMLVDVAGDILSRFTLNESPNNTGMEAVFWNGPDGEAILYNGGVLWTGRGEKSADLPQLEKPIGKGRQGWYHCIPANVCGDRREEVVLYNPWEPVIRIYTAAPLRKELYQRYRPGPRQYNARLMD
jgi:hypothetical protein